MSDQTQIQTLGPVDPNAPLAQKFYAVLAVFGPLVTAASALGMITGEQAASLGQVSTTGTAFVLSVGAVIAAFRTRKQLNNGTFTKAPEPVVLPVVPALEQMKIIRDQAALEVSRGVAAAEAGASSIKAAAQSAVDVLGKLPVPGAAQLSDGANQVLGQFTFPDLTPGADPSQPSSW